MQMLCTRLIKAAPLPSTRCCRWKIKLCLKSIERRRRERERERERERWGKAKMEIDRHHYDETNRVLASLLGNEEPEGQKDSRMLIGWNPWRKLGAGHLF